MAVFYHIEDYKILFPPDNKRLLPPKKDVACPVLPRKIWDVILSLESKRYNHAHIILNKKNNKDNTVLSDSIIAVYEKKEEKIILEKNNNI